MSTRPTEKPYWATDDETDGIYGTSNKEQPSTSKQDYGQRGDENTLRQDINYLFNKIREWIDFFNDQYAVNDVYIKYGAAGTTTDAEISDQLGGTWDYIDGVDGAGTIAGQDVQVFIKINENDT